MNRKGPLFAGSPAPSYSADGCWMKELGARCHCYMQHKYQKKKGTAIVQKIKEVSLLEKDRGNLTPGCWEPVLLTIYHYQCAVKIE